MRPDNSGVMEVIFVILERLISLICDELGCDVDELDEQAQMDELFSDEVELEEMVIVLEGEFGVEFGREFSADMTVEALADLIAESMEDDS